MGDAFTHDLASYNMPIHLVLDGAIVKNIRDHLKAFRLTGRPLFRETADDEILQTGPWLVAPASDHMHFEAFVAAARSAGKGVFWIGECEPEAVYKHLRHLNAARMPDGRILYFRHYDSDVLASIVPLLGGEQAAHLFGPTNVIAFVGGCGDGCNVQKPNGLPEPGTSPIAFEPWQIEELDERQCRLSRWKICHLLRGEFPEQTHKLDDDDLYDKVLSYEREGQTMNLRSAEGLHNWARLNFETRDGASKNVVLKRDISQLPLSQTDEIFVRSMPGLIGGYREAKSAAERASAM